jgi:hypothetical protein
MNRTLLALACLLGLVAQAPGAAAQISTPHDTIPDFCAGPTIQSVGSGRWSSASTWSPARVPGAGDKVRVAAGTTVTFDVTQGAALSCVGIHGALQFDPGVSTRLWAGNVLVYAGGRLQVGTAGQPIPAARTAEIVIANRALDASADPGQYGTAFLAWGEVTIHGAPLQPTFARLAQEPRAGHTALVLAAPAAGWKAGDRVVLPDTRHMRWNEVTNWAPTAPQWEERTVQGVSSDGRTVTLTTALQFDHLGARDAAGVLTFLPHVGNLTRNVVIRSEVPIGGSGTRGHVLFTGRATIDVRYALFRDLGRTTIAALDTTSNHIGRYALHIHHLMGPTATPANGHQFTLVGNAVDGGSTSHSVKWGVTLHDSHYGLVRDNVVYNYAGALFMFEDGSESFNVVERNFALRSRGTGDRLAEGTEGGGFWFRGPNNHVRQNVAANLWGNTTEAAYGYKYFMRYLGSVRVPNFKGADTSVSGQYTTRNGNQMPLLEFRDNEVYSAAQGMTYWWVNSQDPTAYSGAQESLVANLGIWHVFNKAVYHYPSARMTFDGLVIRGRDPASAACCGTGWHGEDYAAAHIVIRNADIQGMNIGVTPSTAGTGPQTIEHSVLRNVTGVLMRTLYSANGGGWLPARHVVVRNSTFAAWPGSSYRAISMSWASQPTSQHNTTQLDELLVYAYQGSATDNFRVYYSAQATQNVAGGLAPCTSTRPEIQGLVCPIAAEPGGGSAPAAPSDLRISQCGGKPASGRMAGPWTNDRDGCRESQGSPPLACGAACDRGARGATAAAREPGGDRTGPPARAGRPGA